MHERLSVHNVTFHGATLRDLQNAWTTLDVKRLSVLDTQLAEPDLPALIDANGYAVQAVYHLFSAGRLCGERDAIRGARDALSRVIEAAATVSAPCIYMLTGGRAGSTWERAAERFCVAIEPCVREARDARVMLAVENASSLYADIHIAHSLRDTITLAEMADVGICIDLFHCWAEAGLSDLLRRALPRTELIQLSDYVLGDRSLPGRAVPGDGAIAIESFVAEALSGGYSHGFDLELIGPRIDAEGRLHAAQRASATVGAMLDRLEA